MRARPDPETKSVSISAHFIQEQVPFVRACLSILVSHSDPLVLVVIEESKEQQKAVLPTRPCCHASDS